MRRPRRPSPTPAFIALLVLGVWLGADPAGAPAAEFTSVPLQRGINYAAEGRGGGYGSDASVDHMAQLHRMGFDAIALTPLGYQRSVAADTLDGIVDGEYVGRRRRDAAADTVDNGPGQSVRDEIAAAKVMGYFVIVKPQIWARDFDADGEWHGTIRQNSPEEHARWWTSYQIFAMHYARAAAESGADAFCIGTELVTMTKQHPDEWRLLAERIRAICRRQDGSPMRITYAAHWDEEWREIPFWDALDWIGVNAYFPLDLPDGANVDQLQRAWEPWVGQMAKTSRRWDRPIVFLEAGYRPVVDCHREPWRWGGGDHDPGAQARAFEAMFAALDPQPWWRGIYIWKTYTDPDRSQRGEGDRDFTFEGKPAGDLIERWLKGPAATAESHTPPRTIGL
jgi:hypothetical protein